MDPGLASRPERLGREELGLDAAAPLPFHFEAGRRMTPMVISFPHVGLEWPTELSPKPQVNFARNADLGVHTLYPGAHEHAATIRARFSRLVVDLNRAADDVDPKVVPDHPAPRPHSVPAARPKPGEPLIRVENRGVVWANAIGNISMFSRPLTAADFERRIRLFHAPYHAAIATLLARRVERFGHAILLDAHSMPGSVPGHLILGTLDGAACHPGLVQAAVRALREQDGLDVRIDNPYRGGEVVRRFGRPSEGVHALQLEVNRGLYMDELRAELWHTDTQDSQHPRPSRGRQRVPNQTQRQYQAALFRRLDQLVPALADFDL